MSWDAYTDQLKQQGCEHAAIVGLDGNPWTTQSPNFIITQAEALKIIQGYQDQSNFQASGIILGGEKFMFLRLDGQCIAGKKGSRPIAIRKINTALVIGVGSESTQPGTLRTAVEKQGDYLSSLNY
ncbi:profilin-A [Lingula anatina]|uniref:Profilin n=1 Tax=Lingula anatina TaxID=7574 RepID=A0A1S3IT70_LINAN|nr:profilin-A [Lingula anatina]|eukprot:XP_013401278.1 profilin-A [Lingula anatina]